jgi:hypothetical protein
MARICSQKKCFCNKVGMGCRVCKQCKAFPFMINEKCDVCFNCEKDDGVLRWDEGGNGEAAVVKEVGVWQK